MRVREQIGRRAGIGLSETWTVTASWSLGDGRRNTFVGFHTVMRVNTSQE